MPVISIRSTIAVAFALLLASCGGGKMLTSIPGGESKVFERPPYAVLGKTRYDQNWIDSQVEGGVAAFGWPRPAPRPPQLDAKPGKKIASAPPVKKKGLIRRLKDRVLPTKKDWPAAAAPVVPTPTPPPVVVEAPEPEPLPPPKARDPVDELLDAPPIQIRRTR